MAAQQTNFDQYLPGAGMPDDAYSGVTAVEAATDQGEYQENAKNLKKPWTLPLLSRPDVKPIG